MSIGPFTWQHLGWAAALTAMSLQATTLRIDAVVFAGGGSTGQSARFRVDGSIGQGIAESDVGESGRFGIRAGFWSQVLPWMELQEPERLDWSVELMTGTPLRLRLRSRAVPGRAYAIQAAERLDGAWSTLARPVAGADGVVVFEDPVGGGNRYYRVVE
jgi:hypothetical protein